MTDYIGIVGYAIQSTIKILVALIIIQIIINLVNGIISYLLTNTIGPKLTWFIMNRATFIGVVHHEFSHALFAFLSGAKITKVALFRPSGDSLGHVSFYPRGNKALQALQLSLASIAPIIMGLLNCYLAKKYIYIRLEHTWQLFIFWYCIFSILIHCNMSKQDIKTARAGLPLSMLVLAIVIFIFKL